MDIKRHNRDHFYKYIPAHVAKLIIENQQLKWSSPRSFNDPFDHKFSLLDVNLDSFKKIFMIELEKTIFDSNEPIDTTTENGRMIGELRLNRDSLDRSYFLQTLGVAGEGFVEAGRQAILKAGEEFEVFFAKSRVLCLTENNDNLLMWAHYGPSHTGAVIKLNVIREMDSNLSIAQKVDYASAFPSLATEQEWIDSFLCLKEINSGEKYFKAIFTKSEEWSYEDEWRLSVYEEGNVPYEDSYMTYPKETFGAIYLGLKMSFKDKRDISTLAGTHLPNMEVWEVVARNNEYKLDFHRIK